MNERFAMQYSTIRYDVSEGIATVTLDRPGRLNAFTTRMMEEIIDAADRIDEDDEVRAAIFTGAGRGFCAGADISDGTSGFFDVGTDTELDADHAIARDGGGRLTLRLFRCLKPLIAAINGPAVGVGVTMTLAMDVRLASDAARFGFVFARRGIVPEAASSWFLPRIVGVSRALEWCYSGRVFGADEAERAGLVRSIHAPEQLLADARAVAREFAESTAPVSVALTRQMMWRGLGMAHPMEAHRVDSRAVAFRGRSADAAEGVASFLDKRPARFPDLVSDGLPDIFPDCSEPEFACGQDADRAAT